MSRFHEVWISILTPAHRHLARSHQRGSRKMLAQRLSEGDPMAFGHQLLAHLRLRWVPTPKLTEHCKENGGDRVKRSRAETRPQQ